MKPEIAITAVYLISIILSTVICKFLKRKVSFARTLSHVTVAATAAYILTSFLWTVVRQPGKYFWNEQPLSFLPLLWQWLILAFPLVVIAVTLLWSVKRQLRDEGNEAAAV